MKTSEFYAGIEMILELLPATIKGKETLSDIGNWDSLAVVSFIAFVDEKMKFAISPDELQKAKTVPDLVSLVKSRLQD